MEWVTALASLTAVGVNAIGLLGVYRQLKIKNEHDARMERLRFEGQKLLAREDQQIDTEKDLRLRRFDAYQELWKILSEWSLSFFFDDKLNEFLPNFLNSLNTWYNNKNGFLLSEESDIAFREVRDSLFIFTSEITGINFLITDLKDALELAGTIDKLIKNLKVEMTEDIGIRRPQTVKLTENNSD